MSYFMYLLTFIFTCLATEIQLTQTTSSAQRTYSQSITLPDGNYLLVWLECIQSICDLKGQWFNDQNLAQTSVYNIDFDVRDQPPLMTIRGDQVGLAWFNRDNQFWRFQAQILTPLNFDSYRQVIDNNLSEIDGQLYANLASLNNGSMVLVWNVNSHLIRSRIIDNSLTQGSNFDLLVDLNHEIKNSYLANGQNYALVYENVSNINGTNQTLIQVMNSGINLTIFETGRILTDPQIQITNQGWKIIFWLNRTGLLSTVCYQKYNQNHVQWGGVECIESQIFYIQKYQTNLIFDESSRMSFVIIYSEPDGNIYSYQKQFDGNQTRIQQNENSNIFFESDVSVSNVINNNFRITWGDGRNIFGKLFYSLPLVNQNEYLYEDLILNSPYLTQFGQFRISRYPTESEIGEIEISVLNDFIPNGSYITLFSYPENDALWMLFQYEETCYYLDDQSYTISTEFATISDRRYHQLIFSEEGIETCNQIILSINLFGLFLVQLG